MQKELKVNITADNSQFNQKVKETEKGIGDLRLEYRRLSYASLVGKSAEEIEKVTQRLAYLKDAIGDTQAKIKSLSLDNFQKIAETTQVATSVMAGMAGATTLMGGNQEELNKIMQKTIALMAVARAAQEIADFAKQRAAGIYLKTKIAEIGANLRNILTIKATTAATITQEGATKSMSMATKGLIFLQGLWNTTVAANPIVWLIAAVAALAVGLYALGKAFGGGEGEAKSYEKTVDGLIIKDEKLREIHNEHVFAMRKLQTEWDALTGKISAHEKDVRDLNTEYTKTLYDIRNNTAKELDEAGGSWFTWGRILTAITGNQVHAAEDLTKKSLDIIKRGAAEELAVKQQHGQTIKTILKTQGEENLKAQKEYNVLAAKTTAESIAAQIALSRYQFEQETKGLQDGYALYELAEAQHNERVAKIRKDAADKSIAAAKTRAEELAKAELAAQEFMFAESVAFWNNEIMAAEKAGRETMDMRLSLVDAMTEQQLAKVKAGSEQEKAILAKAEQEKNEIKRQGFRYMIDLGEQFNSSLAQQLQIATDKQLAYGSTYDILAEHMAIYKAEIDRLIEAKKFEEEGTQSLIATYNQLAAAKLAADTQLKASEEVQATQLQFTEQLQLATQDLAASFGQSMALMAQDSRDAALSVIKSSLAKVVAMLIEKIMATVPFPANIAIAAGAGAATQLLFNQVPALAQGGLAYAPTLAMVGDNPSAAVDPEVIAPLSKLKDMLQGEGGTGQVEFIIKGDVLYGILDKYATYKSRYK